MNILIVRNADPTGYGGAEELVLNTALEVKKHHNVVIATTIPRLKEKAGRAQLNVIHSPWLKTQSWHGWKQLFIPLYFLWLIRLTFWYVRKINEYKLDILHTQNRDDWIASGIAGRLTNSRVIWSDHADLKHEMVNVFSLFKNWQGKLVYWATRFPEVITVDSKAEVRDINRSIHGKLNNKIMVAYNGVYDITPKPVEKNKSAFVFGATSRLLGQKGMFEMIEAFQIISAEHPETELWLVGDGKDREKLEKASEGNKAIHFIGYVENPLDYAASFDVYLQPTYTEGFSLSLLEAAMLELPIITTDVGGNPEIIDHNETGVLIKPHSVTELVSAMQRLYNSPKLRRKISRNARHRFLADFEFTELVKSIYLPLYGKEQ